MFGALPYHIITHQDLTHADVRVLLAFAAFAGEDGRAFPSVRRIESETPLSRRSIQTSLRKCVRLGLLKVSHRLDERGTTSSVYTFQFERFDKSSTPRRNGCAPRRNKDATPAQLERPPGAMVAPKHTKEHTNEHIDQDEPPKKRKRKRATQAPVADNPPTLDEIQRYACEEGNKHRIGVHRTFAAKFALYYGDEWTMKSGKPLKNWRKAVTGWILRDAERNPLRVGDSNRFIPETARRRRVDFPE
jgi:hypothetical protein